MTKLVIETAVGIPGKEIAGSITSESNSMSDLQGIIKRHREMTFSPLLVINDEEKKTLEGHFDRLAEEIMALTYALPVGVWRGFTEDPFRPSLVLYVKIGPKETK